ncbi:hypothetical protein SAMN06265368_4868 [Cohaesibacter gelatinilyticus]|uniref:Uncharacterized protein n=1 Tax=Cohaesibacter gelatinilyticus TaxID=372072 RepID=A0A285PKC9_9HYPH|nr:hypothetical protein SAMN06265368_4868 [Cohaesibacter gelatinilyticus]
MTTKLNLAIALLITTPFVQKFIDAYLPDFIEKVARIFH